MSSPTEGLPTGESVVSLAQEKIIPATVIVAVRNEEANITKCLRSLRSFRCVVVVDSGSNDNTVALSKAGGAQVVQFEYEGGYPKKRQWAMDSLNITTPWILLLDADEVVPEALNQEIRDVLRSESQHVAYFIRKGFHFLGRRFRFGGFSHRAILLFRVGSARFEHLFDENPGGMDMEVHERLIVEGSVGSLKNALVHEDFKGLQAYIARHNQYSSWEAAVRMRYLTRANWGVSTIQPRLFGNVQERRRWCKNLLIRFPMEHWIWFWMHYLFFCGFLEGRRGLIASRLRLQYIADVNAKIYEALRSNE